MSGASGAGDGSRTRDLLLGRRVEGLQRGFDHYVRTRPGSALPLLGEALRERLLPGLFADQLVGEPSAGGYINQDLIEILDATGDRPLYAFLNYTDPHHPYVPPPSDRGTFSKWSPRERAEKLGVDQSESERARLEARYDEEIRALDRYLGELFAELERREKLAGSWIFITSRPRRGLCRAPGHRARHDGLQRSFSRAAAGLPAQRQ